MLAVPTKSLPPTFEVGREIEEGPGSGFSQAEFTLRLSQLIELGAKRAKRVRLAEKEIDVVRWDYEVTRADVLVALSQPGYDRYKDEIAPGALVVVDRDLVKANGVRALPFTITAEEVGYKIVTNMVMLGYLGAALGFIPDEVLEETVLRRIPRGTEDLNRRAVRAGRGLLVQEDPT